MFVPSYIGPSSSKSYFDTRGRLEQKTLTYSRVAARPRGTLMNSLGVTA